MNLSQFLLAAGRIIQLHYYHFDEQEAYRNYAILYISGCLPFYKQHEKTIPEPEFELLIEVIDKLSGDNPILVELAGHLIDFATILHKRTSKDIYLEKALKTLDTIDDSILEKIKIPETSATAIYLKKKNKLLQFISATPDAEELSSSFYTSININPKRDITSVDAQDYLDKIEDSDETEEPTEFELIALDEQDRQALKAALDSLESNPVTAQQITLALTLMNSHGEELFTEDDLDSHIGLLESGRIDKAEMVQIFKEFQAYDQRANELNAARENRAQLLETFEELLHSGNTSSERNQIELIKKLIDSYGQQLFYKKGLTLLLQGICTSDTKKTEEAIKNFLMAYKASYENFPRTSTGKNILLLGVRIILPFMAKQLSASKLNQLLEDSNFHLEDPDAEEHHEPHRYYELVMSFYGSKQIQIDSWVYNAVLRKLISNRAYLHQVFEILGSTTILPETLLNTDSQLPLSVQLIQGAIFEQDVAVHKEFEQLIAIFLRVNQSAPRYQQRNISLFFFKYHAVIIQLIKIMGADGIRYMRNHLAGSVLNLERMLDCLPILPDELQQFLTDYYKQSGISLKQNPKQVEEFKNCLVAFSALLSYQSPKEILYREDGNFRLAKEMPVDLLLLTLVESLFRSVIPGRSRQLSEQEIGRLFERIEPIRFVQLAAASKRMSDDKYQQVYLELLTLDLLGGSVDDFLHDIGQENKLGRSLATHNQSIRKKLTKQGISPETALSYKKTFDFCVLPDDKANLNQGNLLIILWSYLTSLKKEIISSSKPNTEKNQNRITAIKTLLNELENIVKKTQAPDEGMQIANALSGGNSRVLVQKIIRNIDALEQSNADTSAGFKEFAQHVKEQNKLITNNQGKNSAVNKVTLFHFSIVQWPKEKPSTFFLGDEVGCCLATTNNQFPAMVQRRMDDALLFHVAIDKITGQPAALIWLFLVETGDEKNVLIANFFEVNAKYATNDTLRLALLNGLLKFTWQYCQDNPGISAFYMNQLRYGWNLNDLQSYPLCDLDIVDKLGGPFIPGSQIADTDREDEPLCKKELTRQKYYLASLSQSQFHQFDPKILVGNSIPAMIEKDSILKEAVKSAPNIEIDQLTQTIAAKHALELKPFYKSPMETDPCFRQDIVNALKDIADELKIVKHQAGLRFFPAADTPADNSDKKLEGTPPPTDKL
ncbi:MULTISPECIES: hypothetical protein [unclassified Legionella]|uniref:hypothetical protein n=1 Tax=unclassified Legionella TaxID=2622702 RepID=UPI001054B28E|nr:MULTISPECIES: hypothetical protein [unclassified Legionella]MDI9818072.1 hypothetical protein [Legionella sp. PL877]